MLSKSCQSSRSACSTNTRNSRQSPCQYEALGWKDVWVSRTVVLYLSVSTCVDSFQDVVEERIGILECYEYLWLAKQPPLRAERL